MPRRLTALLIAASLAIGLSPAIVSAPVYARSVDLVKQAVAVGKGGAVASVNLLATAEGTRVLREGGNAVDAALAAAAVLGVAEPFSCGIGGGGFMVIYDARHHRVTTIDSRETAPEAFRADVFIDPSTGKPVPFPQLVTSGLGVGVPGTLQAWKVAAEKFGTRPLAALLKPAIRIADQGFVVNPRFNLQINQNLSRFQDFSSTRALYLTPSGAAPAVGSLFRNPDLANTYRLIARQGTDVFYEGPIAQNIVDTVQHPPTMSGITRNVRPGLMNRDDLADYNVVLREPVATSYRGLSIYGMGPPSSGGSTVGESLNILEGFNMRDLSRTQALHRYLEASRLAFADRNAYLGDPDVVDVPLAGLLSKGFAAQRRARQSVSVPAGCVGERRREPGRDLNDPSHRRGSLGQHRQLHLYDRADRRQRDGRTRARLPAEQRTYGLRADARPGQLARPRQAAAEQHEPDDCFLGQPAGTGTGLARRFDNHHDCAAAPCQPGRLWHDAARCHCRPARLTAQHDPDDGGACLPEHT